MITHYIGSAKENRRKSIGKAKEQQSKRKAKAKETQGKSKGTAQEKQRNNTWAIDMYGASAYIYTSVIMCTNVYESIRRGPDTLPLLPP